MPFDIIVPGHQAVRHTLVLEPAPGVELPRLVAHPVRGFGGWTEVRAGEPFEFSGKYGTHLCAVQPGEAVPERVDPAWCSAHASTPIPVAEIASLPLASLTDSVTTELRVEDVANGLLRLRVDGETRTGSTMLRSPVGIVLVLIALVGVGGLAWWFLRRRAPGA